MRKAIIISVLFHVGLLTWALGYFATSTKIKPVTKASVPVDIMTPSQFTKVKAGKKTAKKTKKAAPVVKKKKAAPKKPPKVVKKAAPKPKPKPVKVAKPKPKPKPVKKVEKPKPKKIAKPKPKPAKKKLANLKPKPKPKPVKRQPPKPQSQFDPENIAALLNKLPNKRSAPKSSYKVQLEPAPRARQERPTYGRTYGTDATMSANEIDAFKAQISQCWRPPTGGLGSRDLNVKLRIRFKPDGTLEKPPELANHSRSPFFRPAADAAQRAVWQCQPYRMPKDKFATWQDMILNFDPRDMFGG